MAPNLTLVSHYLCPYVQRAAISLAEKDVEFERVTIDLAAKPDWFKAISPLGKVPLLLVPSARGDTAIFESAVILEYLEETQANPLHPADPLTRARHRAWMEFGSAVLSGIGRLYSALTEQAFRDEAMALASMFDRIEGELAAVRRGSGTWFTGKRFSLVDAVFAPVFRYFDVFDTIGDFAILADKPFIGAWRAALTDRPSVVAAAAPDYPHHLLAFLRERSSHLGTLAGQPATAIR